MRQWLPVVMFVGLLLGCQRQAAGPGPAQIVSTPAGATVFIDNQFVGVTPHVARSLSPGVHSVKLERWGYRRYLGLLAVGQGPARLEVALQEERSGEIRIASVPSDAMVTVNGQHRGRTPLVISGLSAGSYEIRLQLDNCDPWLRTAQLRTAEKMAINAALESPQERFLLDAIARKPKEVTNYTELARHYIIRKKYDQAVGVYKSALQQRDKAMDSRLYQEMGRAYGGQFKSFEDDADMEALHARMIRLFAEAGNAMTFYASAQKYASERPRSHNPGAEKAELEKIQALEQALDQKPDDLAARLELARLYLDRRDSRHAQEQFKLVAQATERNWMTEGEKQKEAAQLARGMVKVDGRWVSAKEAERLALAKLPAEEKARLAETQARLAATQARRAAEEQAGRIAAEKAKREAEELARKAKREAEDLARREKAEKAKREADEIARKREAEKPKIFSSALAPKEREWVMNTSEPGVTWQPETWADPATLKVVPYNSGKALNIAYTGGKNAKACVSMKPPAPVDLSSRGRIVLDVVNGSQTLAMVSVLITADQDYESLPQFVRPGGHQTLVFPIAGNHFKCPRDNWKKYGFPIAQPKNVTRIALVLNSPANLFVKNVKLTK